jgi:rSAM/selenodomain-associated transferase 2
VSSGSAPPRESGSSADPRPAAPARAPTISVVIPTLNEAAWIGRTVRQIARLDRRVEIVVADGGSEDGTVAVARAAGACVIDAPRGRGPQLRAGAATATGDLLVFVHADTLLPDGAFDLLRERFARPQVRIGTFRLRFDREHWLLRAYAACTRVDSVLTRFGDQVIAIRREFYAELGGFPPWERLEDVHLLRIARGRTRVYSFPATVTTSARRFEREGLVRAQLHNAALLLGYLCGLAGRPA